MEKKNISEMTSSHKSLLILCLTLTTWKTGTFRALFPIQKFEDFLLFHFVYFLVESINCYQCSGTDSENPFECNEYFDNDIDILPKDCSSIHNAQYCIKHVGRYEGEESGYLKSLVLGLLTIEINHNSNKINNY